MQNSTKSKKINGNSQSILKYISVFYIFVFLCFSVSLLKVASVITIYAQQDKITASDAAAGDRFGDSVSISGDYAIIGAYADDSSQGSAYIFKRSGETWSEIKKLTASDAAAGDRFGDSVFISGNYAIVGAYGNGDAGAFSGSVYIFYKDQGVVDNWGEVKKITASDAAAGDVFGFNVAIDGEYAVVGAHQDDDGGSLSGSAYIFYKDYGGINNWGQLKKITASDAAANDHFGDDVSISGSVIAVGAWGDNSQAGSAYIFYKDYGGVNTWGQYKKITASDTATADYFGNSISISGDYVVVGALGNDDVGSDSGSAYVFKKGDFETWGQVKKLTASDIADGDNFGVDVSISGNYVIVGARKNDDVGSDSGSAYIFYKDEGSVDNWGEQTKITADDAADSDFFGWSVSISGSYAGIGAYGDDDDGALSGSSYIFYTPPSNNTPSATTSTPSQTSADIVTVTTTIADTDGDVTSSTLQYSINGTDWVNATMGNITQVEALDGVTTSTGSIQDIDTDTDADNSVELTIEWMVSTDLPNTATTTAQIRMTPNDGTVDGTTKTSATFTIDTAGPSPALSALTVNTTSTLSAILNLTTSSDDNFSEYIIYYSTSTPVTVTSTALSSSTFSYFASSTWEGNTTTSLSGLTTNTLYYVSLWAYDSYGNSTSTASELSFYTLTPDPTNFVTTTVASSSVAFSVDAFDNFASGTSGYYFDLALFGGASVDTTGWVTSSNAWSVSSLTPNTRYTASVNYRNGDGVLATTSTLNFYTLAEIPGAPTLSDPSDTTVNITIDAGSNPASTEFAIYNVTDSTYINTSGDPSGTTIWADTSTWGTTTINDLTPNTNYEFYTKARNAINAETAFGSSATAYTAAGTPTSVTASVSGSSVAVSWSGTATEYYVQDSADSSRTSGWISGTSHTFTGLNNNAYIFQVKGRNAELTETASVSAPRVTVNVGGGIPGGDELPDCSASNSCPQDADGSVLINGGVSQIENKEVTLTISSDLATGYYTPFEVPFGQACTTDQNLVEHPLTNGSVEIPFVFSEGLGNKSVCIKFHAPTALNVIFNRNASVELIESVVEGPNIIIAEGEKYTRNRQVNVSLFAPEAKQYRLSEDSLFLNIPYRNMNSGVAFNLSSGDGEKVVNGQFKDDNEEYIVSDSIILDETKPILYKDSIIFDDGVDRATLVRDQVITGKVWDNYLEDVTIKFSFRRVSSGSYRATIPVWPTEVKDFFTTVDADGNFSYSFPFSLEHGKYSFIVYAIDGAGNTDSVVNVVLNVPQYGDVCDAFPPNISSAGYNYDSSGKLRDLSLDGNTKMSFIKNSNYAIRFNIKTCPLQVSVQLHISDKPFSEGEGIPFSRFGTTIQKNHEGDLKLFYTQSEIYDRVYMELGSPGNVSGFSKGSMYSAMQDFGMSLAVTEDYFPEELYFRFSYTTKGIQTFGDEMKISLDVETVETYCEKNPTDPICFQDWDNDLILNTSDNCPYNKNGNCSENPLLCDADNNGIVTDKELEQGNQLDTDSDGFGDVCDTCVVDPDNDTDGDGMCSNEDNCPNTYNEFQEDTDNDGIGDSCDVIEPICGNSIVEEGEDCDGLAPEGYFCSLSCNLIRNEEDPICGNSIVEVGESCDDGNNISEDGCSSSCLSETDDDIDDTDEDGDGEKNGEGEDLVDIGTGDGGPISIFFTSIGGGIIESFKNLRKTIIDIIPDQIKEFTISAVNTIKKVINNPQVEAVNEKVIVPIVAIAGIANVAVGFQLPNILALLRYIFGQPLLALRRRKQKKWGVVYNAFTKLPVGLAMIRIIDASTKKIIRSQVTDAQGRYYLMLDKGEYTIEVNKIGFSGFSEYLKSKNEDTKYINLYHGEKFEITEENGELNYNIPLDEEHKSAETKQILKDYSSKVLHYTIGLSGVFITLGSFIISPNPLILSLFFFHLLLFSISYKIGHKELAGGWGTVTIADTGKKIAKVIVRVFDAEYDKLVGTGVSDRKGRYAVLVGPSTYYATYEKQGFKEKKSEDIDLSSRKTDGMGGIIGMDERLEKE